MSKDVFLCHNSQEKAEVEKIRAQLLQEGIDAWLDKYDFKPFRSWQDQLEEIIPQIKAAAIFIGSSGVGPWADIEMRQFLVEFARNPKLRIGLVILPGCPDELINTVPRFLKGFHWVDFRLQNPDPMEQLIWGITGQKPKTQPITLSQPPQQPSDKRQLEKFDVFLAHNSLDKPKIRIIYEYLRQLGLNPWLDEKGIRPGQLYQDVIQQAIQQIQCVAVFIGTTGLGRWQALELQSFIRQCVERDIPIIPVLLPGVKYIPENLIFLNNFHLVRFECEIKDDFKAFQNLYWGITREALEINSTIFSQLKSDIL